MAYSQCSGKRGYTTVGERIVLRNADLIGSPGIVLTLLAVALLVSYSASADAEELPEGSCEDPLVLVDKEHAVSPSYVPPDLVFLADYGVFSLSWGGMLRENAAGHLSGLIAAAGAEGKELVVASAYRSFYEQSLAYAYYANLYGLEAGRVSAPPGHSEHQLGATADFTNAEVGYEIGQDFGATEAARWLRENAAEYGFVLSYPEGKEEKTGYLWEPWHYRYVGVENARDTGESGRDARDLLLEEGVRPGCV